MKGGQGKKLNWKIYAVSLCFLSFINISCEKFVEINLPNTSINSGVVFDNDQTATAAALGMYDLLRRVTSFGASGSPLSITTLTGFSSDEFDNYSPSNLEFIQNNLTPSNSKVLSVWSTAYSTIYTANTVIEGVNNSKGISPATKMRLEGEAKFIRAFCHFYLVNLFGDIPIVTTTDYRINALASRQIIPKVYQQIVSDLLDAQSKLSETYVSADRARPNKWTATAFLSRVYLYTKDWAKAEATASSVINNSVQYRLVTNLDSVFLAQSNEAIWQLASTSTVSYTTIEGTYFILVSNPVNQTLNSNLLNSFEAGDNRKVKWINSYTGSLGVYFYPYKYKVRLGGTPLKEHSIIFRLVEQYLIRAEARAQQNNLTGSNSAESDLNIIRNRAGLGNTTSLSKAQMLASIEQERRVELFSEWGHRWFDLKRTDRANAVLAIIKAPNWQLTDVLYPIPENELKNDPNLIQNAGY